MTVFASHVHARWRLDARFGCKAAATEHVRQWIRNIGGQAGLNASNTRLCTGAVGVPESRIEMEVTFPTLAAWEQFLAAIPPEDHVAWAKQVQGSVVDGSPTWQVYRAAPVFDADDAAPVAAPGTAARAAGSDGVVSASGLILDVDLSILEGKGLEAFSGDGYGLAATPKARGVPSSPAPAPAEPPVEVADADLPLDWKGEPMRINPGDKLPFKFL